MTAKALDAAQDGFGRLHAKAFFIFPTGFQRFSALLRFPSSCASVPETALSAGFALGNGSAGAVRLSPHIKANTMQKFRQTAVKSLLVTSILALAGIQAVSAAPQAEGINAFQQKVNQIAAKNGVPAPDVKKELQAKTEASSEAEEEARTQEALRNVSPIERIVAIKADTIRAIKARDGKIMYLVDNGRFAFIGKMVDVWNRKELSTIEDIADAVSHIDLARMGFRLEKVNHISAGTGEKHVTVFVDPQCGWCHKLMAEFEADPSFREKYTFDFVVVPVLGDRSAQLAKKLWCAKTNDQEEKFRALMGGARAVEALEQQEDCDLEVYEQTRIIAQAVGVQGVPMIISHDGRFERGKPQNLKAFLEPNASDADEAAELAKAARGLK